VKAADQKHHFSEFQMSQDFQFFSFHFQNVEEYKSDLQKLGN